MTLKHVLKIFSKTEVQEDKTHPCPPLEREGASKTVAQNGKPYPIHLSQTILNRLFGKVLEREGVSISYAEHTVKDLSSNRLNVLTTSKKAAFTLAEVLITLGIIGVVAALTLPTLIANHQKQTLVNQLKKAVNTLENAAQSATADEGVSSFHDTLFKCFFSDGYLCGTPWKDEYKEAGNKYLKTISISVPLENNLGVDYKYINGEMFMSATGSYPGMRKTILNDGMIIYTTASNYLFYIDVNGEKGPNVLGRDLFNLTLDAYGHVVDSANVYTGVEDFGWRRDKIINKHLCDGIDPVADDKCFYDKIVSDGWKMNY